MAPRMRVISDNDYAGDPDGLVQLAQLLLSTSVDVRVVVSSQVPEAARFGMPPDTATRGRTMAAHLLDLVRPGDRLPVVAGSDHPLSDRHTPIPSAGTDAILEEVRRSDVDTPLFLTLGGALTELASAYLLEPGIAERLTVVWIGGPEYAGLAEPPPRPEGPEASEYNLRGDIAAAQVVFDSPIPLWQVPRSTYRQALVSMPELNLRLRPHGPVGEHLYGLLEDALTRLPQLGFPAGETFVLGDSPMVLLTALQSQFEPDPSSSHYATLPAPAIADDGTYVDRPDGRPIRVYHHIDTRLMVEDLYAKLALHAAGLGVTPG